MCEIILAGLKLKNKTLHHPCIILYEWFQEDLDCPPHKVFIKTNRAKARARNSEKSAENGEATDVLAANGATTTEQSEPNENVDAKSVNTVEPTVPIGEKFAVDLNDSKPDIEDNHKQTDKDDSMDALQEVGS